jgi:hypothetical protein
LPAGEHSPFRRLSGVHFARWVVIDPAVGGIGPGIVGQSLRCLLFTATIDGTVDDFVDALRTRIGDGVDEVWGHCAGYPGRRHRKEFRRWLAHNRLHAHRTFAAYDATVDDVRRALLLWERHIAFAQLVQQLPQEDWQDAFREHFWR